MNEVRLKHLLLQRGSLSNALERHESFIQAKLTTATVFEIETRLQFVDRHQAEFDKIQEEIEDIDEAEFTKPDRGRYEERIIAIKSKYHESKARLQENVTEASFANPNNTMGNVVVDICGSDYRPQLPVFEGNYFEFPAFIDQFDAQVHNRQARGMNDAKRMGFLLQFVKGRAFDAISHFPVTGESYAKAYRTLRERFYKETLIFEQHVQRLFEMPTAKDTATLRRLSDGVNASLNAIARVATDNQFLSGLLIHIFLSKCDKTTVLEWEKIAAARNQIPTIDEFKQFLGNRCTVLECVEYSTMATNSVRNLNASDESKSTQRPRSVRSNNCCQLVCVKPETCSQFMELTPRERYALIRDAKKCPKCLRSHHKRTKCESNCSICGKSNHHALLHWGTNDNNKSADTMINETASVHSSSSGETLSTAPLVMKERNFIHEMKRSQEFVDFAENYTFLATAVVKTRTKDGREVELRVLLDHCAQNNFIMKHAARLLGLPTLKTSLKVSGIVDGAEIHLKQAIAVELLSRTCDFSTKIVAAVLPRYEALHPAQNIDISAWELPSNISLADPDFNKPGRVDMILNADISYRLLSVGQISLGRQRPLLQKTSFGWVVAGDIRLAETMKECTLTSSLSATTTSPNDEFEWIKQFWELEEVERDIVKPLSPDQQRCEESFRLTTFRKPDGRYVVRYPLREGIDKLGESFAIARKRFLALERKLAADPDLGKKYWKFLEEYEELDHLEEYGPEPGAVYLPHFYVLKPDSESTPLRVVFDASAPTSTGVSLNDVLRTGATIQHSLFSHLLGLRCYVYIICADMTKMYRQIEIHPDDRKYQHILSRCPITKRLRDLRLKTVTYGTAPAAFLATRCLLDLAQACADLPLGAGAVENEFFMDDLISGANNVKDAIEKFRQTQLLLQRGCFPLAKLISNCPEVLDAFPQQKKAKSVQFKGDDTFRTLGINWVAESDSFHYPIQAGTGKITKRKMLSETASIFSPLGLLQPILVWAKIRIQYAWTLNVDWDESLPQDLTTEWQRFRDELPRLAEFEVRRWVSVLEAELIELHGFCDASEQAYAAAVYVRVIRPDGRVNVTLLCSKSRMAPLRTISVARLEL